MTKNPPFPLRLVTYFHQHQEREDIFSKCQCTKSPGIHVKRSNHQESHIATHDAPVMTCLKLLPGITITTPKPAEIPSAKTRTQQAEKKRKEKANADSAMPIITSQQPAV
jgi:hypothetical protein